MIRLNVTEFPGDPERQLKSLINEREVSFDTRNLAFVLVRRFYRHFDSERRVSPIHRFKRIKEQMYSTRHNHWRLYNQIQGEEASTSRGNLDETRCKRGLIPGFRNVLNSNYRSRGKLTRTTSLVCVNMRFDCPVGQ